MVTTCDEVDNGWLMYRKFVITHSNHLCPESDKWLLWVILEEKGGYPAYSRIKHPSPKKNPCIVYVYDYNDKLRYLFPKGELS